MILVVDNTRRKMRKEIRELLRSKGIPCAVSVSDKIDMLLPASCVVVTERYLLEDVKYMVEFHETSPVYLYDTEKSFGDFVLECVNAHVKEAPPNMEFEDKLYYYGTPIPLTKTELLIARFLSEVPGWHTVENIAAYCLKNGKDGANNVSVHICNINQKCKRLTNVELIDCRRYSGYMISRDESKRKRIELEIYI